MRRLALLFLPLLLSLTLLPVATTEPAATASFQSWTLSPQDEKDYVAKINEIRASEGLSQLKLNKNMRSAARSWTEWMAENETLQHADDIVSGAPGDWLKVGENVGRGGSVDSVWDAFLASPGHAANVLDPEYDLVGVGVIWTADGRLYTTHRFASTASGGSEPAPEPTPTSPPAPTPAPDPTSAPVPAATPLPPPPPTPTAQPSFSPEQLALADLAPTTPPAHPDRLIVTMTLLLAA